MSTLTAAPTDRHNGRFDFSTDHNDLLGAHLSTQGGVPTVFARAATVGARAVALFAKNGNQWKGKPLEDEIRAQFFEERARIQVGPVLTHASYLINLAGTDPVMYEKSIAAMIDELERAEQLGAYAVVLHPGAHLGLGVRFGIDQIARSLDRIHCAIPACKVVTLLETAAGQGSCLGSSFEELSAMLTLVDERHRVGICFDTCHVFSAGYELRTRAAYEATIDSLGLHLGFENVGAFHLNDSKRAIGSRVDRHEHIGAGEIGLDAFSFLLNDPRFTRIPKVIETPKPHPFDDDIRNLTLLRSLM